MLCKHLPNLILIISVLGFFTKFKSNIPSDTSQTACCLLKAFTLFNDSFNVFFISKTYAADPKIVGKLNSAFESIEEWLLKLATPAAAVAVGTGVFMKKFSFGDDERMRLGKKLIKNSLFSYGFILALDLILAAIKSLMG